MKRVILVHGWSGGPDKDWFPRLASELKSRGYEILAPQLPDAKVPRKEKWVPALKDAVGAVDENTFFIAHSMGCQTVLRYLETLPQETKIGGVLFVAGFLKPLANLEGAKEEEIATSWIAAPLDLSKVREHILKSIALFSDNDGWVGLDNADVFRDSLGSEIIIEHEREHFTEAEEPAVLREALKLVS